MAKTKPLPMPVEVVLDSKHLKCAGGTLERAVALVACRFWAAGCPASGLDEVTASQIAKTQGASWERLKMPIMAALADILPALTREYAVAQARRDNIRARIAEAAAKGRATMAARRMSNRITSLDRAKPKLVTSDKATRYVNERAVMTPQELAAIGKQATDTGIAARYQDG